MKVLIPASSNITKMWSCHEEDKNKEYRFTDHHLIVRSDDFACLYNTFSGELIRLEKDETINECRSLLVLHGFLVPETKDEKKFVNDTRFILNNLVKKDSITDFTILTTTDCNARCFYCYEMGRKRISMSSETAHDVSAYMVRVSNKKKVKITWFGGEPLYNAQAIRIICNELKKNKIPYSGKIVTNGLYLNDEIIEEVAFEWNIRSVQITLDGTRNVYNKIKSYVDPVLDPFDTVMENIESCLKNMVRVSIRLNMAVENADDMFKLCDELSQRFKGKDNISVYVASVVDFSKANDKENVEIEKKIAKTEEKLRESGLLQNRSLKDPLKINSCMADSDKSEVILPDGRIGKCEHFSETEIIGDVYHNEKDSMLIASWKERIEDQKMCDHCPLYPTCYRLKKCEWSRFSCTEQKRDRMIQNIKESIIKYAQKC